jgi:hypothetical protein
MSKEGANGGMIAIKKSMEGWTAAQRLNPTPYLCLRCSLLATATRHR